MLVCMVARTWKNINLKKTLSKPFLLEESKYLKITKMLNAPIKQEKNQALKAVRLEWAKWRNTCQINGSFLKFRERHFTTTRTYSNQPSRWPKPTTRLLNLNRQTCSIEVLNSLDQELSSHIFLRTGNKCPNPLFHSIAPRRRKNLDSVIKFMAKNMVQMFP